MVKVKNYLNMFNQLLVINLQLEFILMCFLLHLINDELADNTYVAS